MLRTFQFWVNGPHPLQKGLISGSGLLLFCLLPFQIHDFVVPGFFSSCRRKFFEENLHPVLYIFPTFLDDERDRGDLCPNFKSDVACFF